MAIDDLVTYRSSKITLMTEAIDEIKAKTDNLPENLAETLGDMADKINDILDKCNDIFEKVNE